ncbi:MAG: serine esterase [Verrucomicrobiota bacterium]|jgi:phospholipase/carboxylesterase
MLHYEIIPAEDKQSRRIFVVLHGLGDSIEGWRWLPPSLDLPWLNYLLVNAPEEYYGGWSWFEYPGDIAPGIDRSRKLLFALLDDLRARGFAADQITLGGFSQGCLMAIETGLHYPHRLAGIVGLSGWVFGLEDLLRDLSPVARAQRLLITHGRFDPLLPFAETQAQVRRLQAAGLNVEWREFPKEHTIYGAEEVAVIRDFVRAGYAVVVG